MPSSGDDSYAASERAFIEEWEEYIELGIDTSARLGIPQQRLAEAILRVAEGLIDDFSTLGDPFDDYLMTVRKVIDTITSSIAAGELHELERLFRRLPDGQADFRNDYGFLRNVLNMDLRKPVMELMLVRTVRELPRRVDRLGELLDVLVRSTLPNPSKRYLARAARLYIQGFRLESVVYSRAAMEAALREVLSDQAVMESSGTRTRGEPTLADSIHAAEAVGVLSQSGAAAAREISRAANSILHDDLALPPGDRSAFGILSLLRHVLEELDAREHT